MVDRVYPAAACRRARRKRFARRYAVLGKALQGQTIVLAAMANGRDSIGTLFDIYLW